MSTPHALSRLGSAGLSALVLCVFVAGCESTPSNPAAPDGVIGATAAVSAEAAGQPICHVAGYSGHYRKVEVAPSAIAAHLAHGDVFPLTPSVSAPFRFVDEACGLRTVAYGTGVDDAWNLLPSGTRDPHYRVRLRDATGFGKAYASSDNPAAWVDATARSQWINPTGDGAENFPFQTWWTFETEFSLKGLDPSTLEIDIDVAADNRVDVYLNGTKLGIWGYFDTFQRFTLKDELRAGRNTLRLDVLNTASYDSPMGLHVNVVALRVP